MMMTSTPHTDRCQTPEVLSESRTPKPPTEAWPSVSRSLISDVSPPKEQKVIWNFINLILSQQ